MDFENLTRDLLNKLTISIKHFDGKNVPPYCPNKGELHY
ncbi:hypothetical protein FM107_06155 [Sphingobacterium sp. JB170]|nr:hypothetical protein FM107_06155 [Sphingobacterium sp. JB170]